MRSAGAATSWSAERPARARARFCARWRRPSRPTSASSRDASALLEALSTGHAGSLTTLHAGSARDALGRLELLLARAGELSSNAIIRHVARAIDVIAHLDRHPDGRRVVREIARVEDEIATIVWSHDR